MYRRIFLALCELLIDEFLNRSFIYRKCEGKKFRWRQFFKSSFVRQKLFAVLVRMKYDMAVTYLLNTIHCQGLFCREHTNKSCASHQRTEDWTANWLPLNQKAELRFSPRTRATQAIVCILAIFLRAPMKSACHQELPHHLLGQCKWAHKASPGDAEWSQRLQAFLSPRIA